MLTRPQWHRPRVVTRRHAPGAREPGADIVVRKYGGSSLASLSAVRRIASATAEAHRAGQAAVLVVSAQGDATDDLLRLVDGVGPEVATPSSAREVDQLLVTGEAQSAALMTLALQRIGLPAVSLTGAQTGILAAGKHGSGMIDEIDTARVRRLLGEGNVVVVAGFHGFTRDGDLMTLGRGGSDTTAVALAAALQARRCEIYTDVDGVCTADPRVVAAARVLDAIDVRAMAEMAFAGAKVLHSRAVELAAMQGIELHVRSCTAPGDGTVITRRGDEALLETDGAVTAITHDLDVARVLVHAKGGQTDLAADILLALSGESAPVDMVARSGPYEPEFRMGFTIRRSDVPAVRLVLQNAAARFGGGVRVDEDLAKVSLIGMGLLNRPEYAARMIHALAAQGIPTSWVSTSQLRASVIVPRGRALDAVNSLHEIFELETAVGDAGVGSVATA